MNKRGLGKKRIFLLSIFVVLAIFLVYSGRNTLTGFFSADLNEPPVYIERNLSADAGVSFSLDLSSIFNDPEGANLSFSVENTDAVI